MKVAMSEYESLMSEANDKMVELQDSKRELLEALEEIVLVMRANPQTGAISLLSAVERAEAAIQKAKAQ